VAVIAVSILIIEISERWWLSTALTYLPRIPFAVPSLILAACAVRWRPRLTWLNLAAAGLVLGPVAELHLPSVAKASVVKPALRVKIVSCNVQGYSPDLSTVLQEISTFHPNVVALQEASQENALLEAYFQDWHVLHEGEFWIASEYPLRRIDTHESAAFGTLTAVNVELDTPAGSVRLTNLHQATPRHALYELNVRSILDGEGPDMVERHTRMRDDQSRLIREFSQVDNTQIPQLIVGDFNMPTTSQLYRSHWGDLQNAFDEAGVGFGYTSPCAPHRLWPDYCPWIRVDHILTSDHWETRKCEVGKTNGSDHRLIAATIFLGK
jgi:vancomycin resistance protein VanJ